MRQEKKAVGSVLGFLMAVALFGCASIAQPDPTITEEAALLEHFQKDGLAAANASAGVNITVSGFLRPESVLHDVKQDLYLVSNINGPNPRGFDNNGFISRVAPNGTILNLKWIEGGVNGVTLNAPKGSTIANGVLYVADIDTLRKFDAKTGKPLGGFALGLDDKRPAQFLNDVTSDCYGNVYVTDIGFTTEPSFGESGLDAIYKITPNGKVSIVAQGNALLNHPNGIDVLPNGKLIVANFDPFQKTRNLYTIDARGNKQVFATLPALTNATGGEIPVLLDGVVVLRTGVLVSAWNGGSSADSKVGKVFFVKYNGAITEVASGLENPSDIGFDYKRNRLLLPELPEPDNRGNVFIRGFNQHAY